MSYATLRELNNAYRMEAYYGDSMFFYSTNPPPKHLLYYIQEYFQLPESEIKKNGFCSNTGSPADKANPRLFEQVTRGIHWYVQHDLSIYKALIEELIEMNIATIQIHHTYTLRYNVYGLYNKLYRLINYYLNIEPIQEIYQQYLAWFKAIDEKLLHKTLDYPEILSHAEIDDALKKQSKLSVIHKVLNTKKEKPALYDYDDSRIKNNVSKIRVYIESCTKRSHLYEGIRYYVDRILLNQHILIKEQTTAIAYGVLVKELLLYVDDQKGEMFTFALREALRVFHAPIARYTSEPENSMIYPDADMEEMYALQSNTMNENEWVSWFKKMKATKIPIFESRSWKRLLHYGMDLFKKDPIVFLQEEYDRKVKKNREYTPLEIHGTIIIKGEELPIIIYGEIHNQIDNQFYEKQGFDQRDDMTMWVEHNAATPILKPGEEAMFTHAKGSEWVWFHRVLNRLPVTCIDIRMQLGLPSALTEDAMRSVVHAPTLYNDPMIAAQRNQHIQQHRFHDIHIFIRYLEKIIKIYRALRNYMNVIDDVYMLYSREINKQIQMIKRTLEANDKKANYEEQFFERLTNVVFNMIHLNSIIVDGHIIQQLKSYNDTKPLAIFVGMNHACRLAKFLDWKVTPNPGFDWEGYYSLAMYTLKPTYSELQNKEYHSPYKESVSYTNDVDEYRVPSLQKSPERLLQKSIKSVKHIHVSKKRSPHKTYKIKRSYQPQ